MKYNAELSYWKRAHERAGGFGNDHYTYLLKDYWGLTDEDISGKRLLDVGCGPRGSLEWADGAALRIGLDPLALAYEELRNVNHKMQYVCAFAEHMPFSDNSFDIVYSINSLDHVDDIEKVTREIQRILAPGGHFFLAVEIHPTPTQYEPVVLEWDVYKRFPSLELVFFAQFEHQQTMPEVLSSSPPFDHSNQEERNGFVAARFFKRP